MEKTTGADQTTVASLGEYLDAVGRCGEQANPDSSFETLWFRGQTNAQWHPEPSIHREYKRRRGFRPPRRPFDSTIDASERASVHELERWYTNDFQHTASVFMDTALPLSDFPSWLTLMQHYTLPTRLLDWSRSSLFALYFAIVDNEYMQKAEGEQSPAGAVWALAPLILNRYTGLEPTAYLYHMQHRTVADVVYTAFRENQARENDDHFDRYRRAEDTVVAAYATLPDRRVANQQSVFTVHSSVKTLTDIHIDIVQHRTGPYMLQKIIIDGAAKDSILRDLYLAGITHSTVFPDLEHVALDIQRYYGSRR
jgi:hypothetical protein